MTIAIPTSQTSTSVPYTKPTPANAASYKPTHPGLVKVVLQQGEQGADGEDTFSSFLVAERVGPFFACALLEGVVANTLDCVGSSREHGRHAFEEPYAGNEGVFECTTR